ncbi:MAG: PepSY domain-containing protein [Kouleothrix sp.]|nr:PepSY domain-containing protein [Kouleothrix sp.]
MMQKTALTIAAAITAFILVLVGGVAAYLTTQTSGATPAEVVQPAATTGTSLDPTALQAAIQQRDAAYQQQIQQANQQLSQAYQQQQDLANQLDQASQSPSAPASQAYAVSRDIAVAIGQAAAPGAALAKPPELVDFQGVVAYEVVLDRGSVYVDANTGQVLYNGAAAAPSGRRGEHEDGEHEEHEGDD